MQMNLILFFKKQNQIIKQQLVKARQFQMIVKVILTLERFLIEI